MAKHICIKDVPNKSFTIGKNYIDLSGLSESTGIYRIGDGVWIRDDNEALTLFMITGKSSDYFEYFEDELRSNRNQRIENILNENS